MLWPISLICRQAKMVFKVYNPTTGKMDLWATDKNGKSDVVKRNVSSSGIN